MKSRYHMVSTDRRLTRHRPDPALETIADEHFISDTGPAERWQHTHRVFALTDPHDKTVTSCATEECVLDILYLQQQITRVQLSAALRLKADFIEADLGTQLGSTYNPARVNCAYYSGYDDRTDEQERAYKRWRTALVSVGELLRDCLVTVVCHDIPPSPMHILPLQMGLVELVGYYKGQGLDDNVDQAASGQVGICASRGGEAHRVARRLH